MNATSAKELFTKHLKSGEYRITPERFLILDVILKKDGHFDADELYIQMKSEGAKISRATVYNTLSLLLDCGLVSKYHFGENHSRYEKTVGRPRHDHLICLECGDIIEFENEKLIKLQDEVCKKNNFKAQSSTLQIFGVCGKH